MKILVTGSNGFIGKNLVSVLKNISCSSDRTRKFDVDREIMLCDMDTAEKDLDYFCEHCNFVFHLAGVNRPENVSDFFAVNCGFTSRLLEKLKKYKNKAPVLMSSSIQAERNNDYGNSKKAGERYLLEYGKNEKVKVFIFRLPNVFGKWCRPNYNSAIATFCYNIARDLPIQISDRNNRLNLVYIDDVVNAFIDTIEDRVVYDNRGYATVSKTYETTLGKIVDTLYSFRDMRQNFTIPNLSDELTDKLYSTYLGYLPEDGFSYPLKTHADGRGSFTEFIKTFGAGQVSVNVCKPHIVKGEHWHQSKNEKFFVVGGTAVVRFRKFGSKKIIEYRVNGNCPEVVDIPTGYTHNIENIGETDLITVMWCNEVFDAEKPDTYALKVQEDEK